MVTYTGVFGRNCNSWRRSSSSRQIVWSQDQRAKHGLYRSLINNMVVGVTEGFTKSLELVGVGYRASIKDKN
jgi:ribosomal protein L6P/L9E